MSPTSPPLRAPGTEWTGAVLAERGKQADRTDDGIAHRCDLATCLGVNHGIVIASGCKCRRFRGVPGRTERMCPHVRNRGRLLGGVRRSPGRRCRRLPSGSPCRTTSPSNCISDLEFAVGEGASLNDRGSHSRIVGRDGLEDDEHMLSAFCCPRRKHAAIVDAQRLRGRCHPTRVGRGWLLRRSRTTTSTCPSNEAACQPARRQTASCRPRARGSRGSRIDF